ncbi:MAG: preprotein translocase subunit YajC [Clostridiales bacterium]|nr:preprotein translocase subunit YajC [Clostridiales bacterium]
MNYLIMLAGEATTLAEEATTLDVSGGGSASVWDTIKAYGFPVLMIVGLILVFWLLIIRPQKKQEKETQKMRNSIMVGDTITTIGGINGIVRQIKEDEDLYIIESSADKSKIAVKRWALQSKDASGAESLAAESAAADAKLNGEKKK